MRSLLKVYICLIDCTCLIVRHTRQCMYTHFIALVICRNFFSFLCLERASLTSLLLSPFPVNILWSSSVKNQITSPPLLNWPLEFPHVFSLLSLENLRPQVSTLCHLFEFFVELLTAHHLQQVTTSPAELVNKGFS